MSIPRIDPEFTVEDLKEAADKFMEAGYAYWEACHKASFHGGGALVWCSDTNGRMVMFTRVEYRHTLLENVHKIGNPIEFGAL